MPTSPAGSSLLPFKHKPMGVERLGASAGRACCGAQCSDLCWGSESWLSLDPSSLRAAFHVLCAPTPGPCGADGEGEQAWPRP